MAEERKETCNRKKKLNSNRRKHINSERRHMKGTGRKEEDAIRGIGKERQKKERKET